MLQTNFVRFLIPSNPFLFATLLLCFFNYLLFVVVSNIHNVSCPKDDSSIQRYKRNSAGSKENQDHWKISEKNQFWLVEMAKYSTFDWEAEMERLFDLIPVMEIRTNSTKSQNTDSRVSNSQNTAGQWGRDFRKSPTLPLVTDVTKERLIAEHVKRINSKLSQLHSHENGINNKLWKALMDEVLANGILGCKEISRLEKAHTDPRIKYSFRTFTQWRGEIKINSEKSVPIKLRRFERKKAPPKAAMEKMNYVMLARQDQKPYFDKAFEHAKHEVINILRTQGWYGTPRLFGLCIASQKGDDIVESILSGKKGAHTMEPKVIRYLVSRHEDNVIKMCDSYFVDYQCERLFSVMRLVNINKNPALAAMKVMLNTAKLFEQFWLNGAVIYDFIGTDFLVDSNCEVMITDMSSVKFLPQNEYSQELRHSHVQRLLSGTICTSSQQCAMASWQASSISYKFGLHCNEVRGFCTGENRCWGINSGVHACVLSRWFFMKLRTVIPSGWSHDQELSDLLFCASKQTPKERCTWTQLRTGLSQLYELAEKEWGKP